MHSLDPVSLHQSSLQDSVLVNYKYVKEQSGVEVSSLLTINEFILYTGPGYYLDT